MMTAPALPPEMARPGSVGRIPEGELAIRGRQGQLFCRRDRPARSCCAGRASCPAICSTISMACPAAWRTAGCRPATSACVDESGFLTIVGRTKEIINRGGEKISPYDVEKALLAPSRGARGGGLRRAASDGSARMSAPRSSFIAMARRRRRELHRFHLRSSGAVPDAAAHPCPGQRCRSAPTGKISRRELSALSPTIGGPRTGRRRRSRSLIADIWQRLLQRDGYRHGRRLLRDRRRFAAGHRDAARARGDDAPPHRPVGRARAAHDSPALRNPGQRARRRSAS